VKVEFSAPNLIYYDQMQLLLGTLGPATNRQVYSSIEDVPLSFSVPPAVEIPTGADGVQEVTLVVSPQGYSPVHFSVKKDVRVRLIFRQLGQVGCGNELIFQWSTRKNATLILASESDKQVLEFTPGEAGEFQFNCPHLIYRGVMTVID
jgi:plastocyanin domain-containing protein